MWFFKKFSITSKQTKSKCDNYIEEKQKKNLNRIPSKEDLFFELEEAIRNGKSTKHIHFNLFSTLTKQKDYKNALNHLFIAEIYHACGAHPENLNEFLRGKNEKFFKEFRKPGNIYFTGRYFCECVNALNIKTKKEFKKYFLSVEITEPVELPFTKEQLCGNFLKAWDTFIQERKNFKQEYPNLVKSGEL